MDRLDMALDDLIKDKPKRQKKAGGGAGAGKKTAGKKQGVAKAAGGAFKKNTRAGSSNGGGGGKLIQPTGASHVIVQPGATSRRQQDRQQPRAGGASSGGSILSRVGAPGSSSGSSGTAVSFENLNFDIMKDDISELCGTIGEVKNVEVIYDRSGRSTGAATATFARRSDAVNAVKKFNGLTLDGTKMIVKLAGANGKENPFNPSSGGRERRESADGKASMFGTAMHDRDESTSFKVNLGGSSGPGVCYAFQKGECTRGDDCRFQHAADEGRGGSSGPGVCYAFQKGECTRGDDCRFQHVAGDVPAQRSTRPAARESRGNRERTNSGGGGRGGGKGGKGGRGGGKVPASAMDLDDDLDGYFASR